MISAVSEEEIKQECLLFRNRPQFLNLHEVKIRHQFITLQQQHRTLGLRGANLFVWIVDPRFQHIFYWIRVSVEWALQH